MNQQEPLSIQSTEDPYKNLFTSTIATTTTPLPMFNKQNKNTFDLNDPNNFHQPYNSDFTTKRNELTTKIPIPLTTTTTKQSFHTERQTINPFYYGFNYKKSTTSYPFFKSFTFTTTKPTKNPYHFNENSYLNQIQTTSSTVNTSFASYVSSTPSIYSPFVTPTTTTTLNTPIESSFVINKNPSENPKIEEVLSSTRNPVFDLYLKRTASTTKNPYNFRSFGQFFKTTTTNPKFAFNLFGANSNTFNTTLPR